MKRTVHHNLHKTDCRLFFSRESDEYGRDIPPSDSYLAKAFSQQPSLSTIAKRKRFSLSLQQKQTALNPTSCTFSKEQGQEWIHQYSHNSKQEHVLYATTANDIGSKKPTLATLPAARFDISQKFSSSFHTTMFHDHGLNMALTRSKVHKLLDPSFT